MRGTGPPQERQVSERRLLQVYVAIAIAVAVIGLISGVRGTGREVRTYVAERPPPMAQIEARSYADMRAAMYGPNAAIQPAWWNSLRVPDPFAPVVQTATDREATPVRRARRRAYDGAPPTIPHAIDQRAVPACAICHERGLVIGDLIAPAMSHAPYGSCVQCHVVAADPRPGSVTPPAPASTFVGLEAPGGGARAWDGAPPTIPHTTWMRDRCESCHGVFGALGMRTTHPWRQSCTQCHAPSATLDQRAPAPIARTP